MFMLKNIILTLFGKPRYVPLYKKIGGNCDRIGWIKEDLSKAYIGTVEMLSAYYEELDIRGLNLEPWGDGYAIVF